MVVAIAVKSTDAADLPIRPDTVVATVEAQDVNSHRVSKELLATLASAEDMEEDLDASTQTVQKELE